MSLGCQCTSKTRNSESNSQLTDIVCDDVGVVNALVKLEILKAIHNSCNDEWDILCVVNALVKLESLKAIHNYQANDDGHSYVVNALVKLEILKAIHN